jgi:2,4-dienoyl-CoA reductase-like NADH-dependent reductase (Old Yellow Enzyme family)
VTPDNEIDLTETKKIIEMLRCKGVNLVNITLGNPYLIPHINRPCINSPEDGNVGMKRILDITKEIKNAFPDMKIVMSGLTFEGVNAVDYAEKMLLDGVTDFVGFGRMTFAYPSFYRDFIADGKLDKNKICLKCSKCTELMRAGTVAGCPVRDSEVYMPLYKEHVMKR